jgi:CRISPR-associated protein Cas5t
MLWLEIQAPFAACRALVAGWYRPTAGFLTHSAVYGLVLNLAGVESRLGEHEDGHDGVTPASLTRDRLPEVRLPKFQLALGVPEGADNPGVQSLYQQLHGYLQDNTKVGDRENPGQKIGKQAEGFRRAKGNKYHIAPVRREILCDVRAVAVVEADADFEAAVRRGLRGDRGVERYGLPFLGDNNFTPDRLEAIGPRPTRWYTLAGDRAGRPRAGTTRLTTYVDRASTAGTRSALFAPDPEPGDRPPETSLVPVGDPVRFDGWLRAHLAR